MSRQVGFAIGVALLVAVFTGTIDNQLTKAQQEVAAVACPRGSQCFERVFSAGTDPSRRPPKPATSAERRAERIVEEHVRNSYAAALRVASLVTLFAIPFSMTMRRRPGDIVEAGRPREGPEGAPAVAS